jgi:LysR family transcriptional activator of nhaA
MAFTRTSWPNWMTLKQSFYAISVERKIRHPAVLAICETARKSIFA